MIRFDRASETAGGGILLYIRKGLKITYDQDNINKKQKTYTHPNKGKSKGKKSIMQFLSIDIQTPIQFKLVVIYRPPKEENKNMFFGELKHILSKNTVEDIVVLGDFNMERSLEYAAPPEIREQLLSRNIEQKICHTTHLDIKYLKLHPPPRLQFKAERLDHAYTNVPTWNAGVLRSAVSDHDTIFLTMPVDIGRQNSNVIPGPYEVNIRKLEALRWYQLAHLTAIKRLSPNNNTTKGYEIAKAKGYKDKRPEINQLKKSQMWQ